MPSDDSFMRFMAAWALVHETADEGWKAAVERGAGVAPGEMASGPEAFVDGLSAAIAQEKERLKERLASGEPMGGSRESEGLDARLDALQFEVAEVRGRMESMQASIDALVAELGKRREG